jgi:hypothetical protein
MGWGLLAGNEDPEYGNDNSEANANPQSACCSDFTHKRPAAEATDKQ